MAGLHLRTRPGEHRLAGEAFGMVKPGNGFVEFGAVCADRRPEGQRDLLVGRHAHLPAQ
jgi:hypothetical protein